MLARYYHTLKYLKWTQLYGQFRFRLSKPKINTRRAPLTRVIPSHWTDAILKSTHMPDKAHIIFLNQKKNIATAACWSQPDIDKLWLYHLHYFDVLNSREALIHPAWMEELIERWIKENPAGKGCGFEPYTLSLRIVNWIKWLLAGHAPVPHMLQSLAEQVRFLTKRLETHLLGNHLLANAKALLFAGCFFEGAEAKRWLRKGVALFQRELREQVLKDGGHFELSPMYQGVILEDVLDVINVFKTYARECSTEWLDKSEMMLKWLGIMSHPDADIAFFNDAALGESPRLHDLAKYYERLSLREPPILARSHDNLFMTHLAHSGYCRMQSGEAVLIADVAKVGAAYQPGHAHADTLSFEFSLGKQRLFVNSGTSSYTESEERLRQRGSKAHNTLVINDDNSSEVWKSFRVARRANIKYVDQREENQSIFLKACHDGYYRKHSLLHERSWRMLVGECQIIDMVTGRGHPKIELMFHLHPTIQPMQRDEQTVFLLNAQHEHIATIVSSHLIDIRTGTYHPAFNESHPNFHLAIEARQRLPATFTTTIKWNV